MGKEDIQKQLNKQAIEKKEQEKQYQETVLISKRNKKQKWTEQKLLTLEDEEVEYFIEMARHKLPSSSTQEQFKIIVGEKFIREYAMCLMRKYYNCPFA